MEEKNHKGEINMMLRIIMVLIALSGSMTPKLFGGTTRADRLLAEAGGITELVTEVGLPVPTPPVVPTTDFFNIIPPGEGIAIAAGGDIPFPFDGPTSGAATRLSDTTFLLPVAGIYQVEFVAHIAEGDSQLVVTLDGAELTYTLTGRNVPVSLIVGSVLVQTAGPAILTIRNPAANAPITLAPVAGTTNPTSAHLVITRLP